MNCKDIKENEYSIELSGSNLTNDKDSVKSECNAIQFDNIGDAVATLEYGGVTRTLEQGTSITVGSDQFGYRVITAFDISFGAGTRNLVITKVFIKRNCQ